MTAAPVRLRPRHTLRIEAAGIRSKLPGPVWRVLARLEDPLWAPEDGPGAVGVVEIEEGHDRAYVLSARRWHQLQAYVHHLEERIAELDPETPQRRHDRPGSDLPPLRRDIHALPR